MPTSIKFIPAGTIQSTIPPPPPPPTPPPPPPSPSSCVAENTMIWMWDGGHRQACRIRLGDVLRTPTGEGGKVIAVQRVPLDTRRKMLWVGGRLRITDDHDFFVKDPDETYMGWGTHNIEEWRREAEELNTGDVGAIELPLQNEFLYASTDGWEKPHIIVDEDAEPNEWVYGFSLDSGIGFFAERFLVISTNCSPDDMEGFTW